jgi:hypothetical protein
MRLSSGCPTLGPDSRFYGVPSAWSKASVRLRVPPYLGNVEGFLVESGVRGLSMSSSYSARQGDPERGDG